MDNGNHKVEYEIELSDYVLIYFHSMSGLCSVP